jgi:hypothetical protein
VESAELYIEALIFSSEQSLRIEEVAYCLQTAMGQDFTIDDINSAIHNIQKNLFPRHQPATGTTFKKEIEPGRTRNPGHNCLSAAGNKNRY